MNHTVFSTYKHFIEIIFVKDKIFIRRFLQRGSQSSEIIISLGTKFGIIVVIVLLKTNTFSLTFKLVSADSQLNKSTALFT